LALLSIILIFLRGRGDFFWRGKGGSEKPNSVQPQE
jgi:hypothetical protein